MARHLAYLLDKQMAGQKVVQRVVLMVYQKVDRTAGLKVDHLAVLKASRLADQTVDLMVCKKVDQLVGHLAVLTAGRMAVQMVDPMVDPRVMMKGSKRIDQTDDN